MFRPNQTHSRKPRLTAPGHERFNVPATSQQLAAAVVSAVMDTGILCVAELLWVCREKDLCDKANSAHDSCAISVAYLYHLAT